MACCTDPQMPLEEDYSVADASTDISSTGDTPKNRLRGNTANRSGSSKPLVTPYSRATPLFRAIEKENWESVLTFLNTSKWSNSFFVSTADHMTNPTPYIQCQTWVTAFNEITQREEWSQLPLHAAISYRAPAVVIQKLVDLYPEALKKCDNEGMLPIHLAFGFALPDSVLSLLLKTYPESAQVKGPGGRLPHECCELGPNKTRGEVFELVAEQTASLALSEQQEVYKTHVRENCQRLELEDVSKMEHTELTVLLAELLEDRKQLRDLKQKLRVKLGNSGKSSAVPVTVESHAPLTPSKASQKLHSPRSPTKDPSLLFPPSKTPHITSITVESPAQLGRAMSPSSGSTTANNTRFVDNTPSTKSPLTTPAKSTKNTKTPKAAKPRWGRKPVSQ